MEPRTQDNSAVTNEGIEEKYGDKDHRERNDSTNDKQSQKSDTNETANRTSVNKGDTTSNNLRED